MGAVVLTGLPLATLFLSWLTGLAVLVGVRHYVIRYRLTRELARVNTAISMLDHYQAGKVSVALQNWGFTQAITNGLMPPCVIRFIWYNINDDVDALRQNLNQRHNYLTTQLNQGWNLHYLTTV